MILICCLTGFLSYLRRLKKQSKDPLKELNILSLLKKIGLRRKEKVKPVVVVKPPSTRKYDEEDAKADRLRKKREVKEKRKELELLRIETESLERSQNPLTVSDRDRSEVMNTVMSDLDNTKAVFNNDFGGDKSGDGLATSAFTTDNYHL